MSGEIHQSGHMRRIAKLYDGHADGYDDGYSTAVCRAEDAVVREILLPYLSGKTLDIGAGSGLLHDLMPELSYVGIELSERMTRSAQQKHPREHFAVADMHALPFSDNSFDSAVSLYGPLSYSLQPDELVNEILRVVKPGGYIALMPYSLRVGHKIEMGGYSTATAGSVEKKYYTQEMLERLLAPLEDVSIQGINYFLNTHLAFSQAMHTYAHDSDVTFDFCLRFLQSEKEIAKLLPVGHARHMIGIGRKKN